MTKLGIILAALVSGASGAEANTPSTLVHRVKDCGSFRVEADTYATEPVDLFSQSPAQTIRFISPPRHIDIKLNLGQHKSPTRGLGGRLGLDALAYEWGCIRSRTGRSYLKIYMFCVNENAKTCHTAMDMPGHEWNLIYDDSGRLLLAHPGDVTAADERRLRQLGIWKEFYNFHETRDDDLVYW